MAPFISEAQRKCWRPIISQWWGRVAVDTMQTTSTASLPGPGGQVLQTCLALALDSWAAFGQEGGGRCSWCGAGTKVVHHVSSDLHGKSCTLPDSQHPRGTDEPLSTPSSLVLSFHRTACFSSPGFYEASIPPPGHLHSYPWISIFLFSSCFFRVL